MQGSINFDGTLSGAISGGGGGGGSDVVITPVVTSGTKIADVSVNGVEKDLYCPSPTEVSVSQVQQSGTKIASIEVNGQSVDLYAPTPSAPTEVSVTQVLTEGEKIGSISVNGVSTDLFAPEGGSGGGVVYSSVPHIVGTWTDGNVTKDVWECTFIFPPQYYGEGQHDLTSLNIDRMLMMQGLTNLTTASYQTPFYQNNSNFEFYRWQSPNLVVLQPSDWYGKERDRTVTIRYTTSS